MCDQGASLEKLPKDRATHQQFLLQAEDALNMCDASLGSLCKDLECLLQPPRGGSSAAEERTAPPRTLVGLNERGMAIRKNKRKNASYSVQLGCSIRH